MKSKKIIGFVLFVFLIQIFANGFIYAKTTKSDINEKLVIIMVNRLDLEDFKSIDAIGKYDQGYIGLMNVRGANVTNDASSYASIGWGRKSYVLNEDLNFFEIPDKAKSEQYRFVTKKEPGKISNLSINTLIQTNSYSDYGSVVGNLGEIANKNNLKLSVIGNSNKENPLLFSGLIAMDSFGRINAGNIDDVNMLDYNAPYDIRTDYDKVLDIFKEHYKPSDIIVIELGDSYRLDEYKKMMSEIAYDEYKKILTGRIDSFISNIKNKLSENDTMMIVSPFPSMEKFNDGYKLSPIYIFNNAEEGAGILTSASTRRDGVISNIDISAYINNKFGLVNEDISGKTISTKPYQKAWAFLEEENEKIVSLSSVRIPVLYTYAVFEMCVWILTVLIGLFYNKIPKIIIKAVKFILRITLLVPLVILIIPVFDFTNALYSLIIGLFFLTVGYAMILKFIKNDLNTIAILSGLMSIILLLDMAVFEQFLIKNSLLGYDPIIGARFYGIGNEYMGVLVGASIMTVSIFFEKFGYKNSILIPFSLVVIFIMGNPMMGANVGGTITISASFLFLILKSNNIKIDIKKSIGIFIAIVLIVSFMAWMDFNNENKSHLANAIMTIIHTGPSAILQIILRKLSMNMRLISASMWSKVFILAIIVMAVLFYKPFGVLKRLCQKHSQIANGWAAIVVGSVVGFMVNDSGIVAAATSIGYVIVPMLVLLLNNGDDIYFLKR